MKGKVVFGGQVNRKGMLIKVTDSFIRSSIQITATRAIRELRMPKHFTQTVVQKLEPDDLTKRLKF